MHEEKYERNAHERKYADALRCLYTLQLEYTQQKTLKLWKQANIKKE